MIKSLFKSYCKKRKLKQQNTVVGMRIVPSDLVIGKYCIIGKKAIIAENVKIGNYTYLNSNVKEVIIESNVEIGNFCSIAPGVIIGLGNHYLDLASTHPFLFNEYYKNGIGNKINLKLNGLIDRDVNTIIESDVWIGANAIINRGVKIGKGAVIASGAVVTKDVPPYTIYGGVPAKKIGQRFDDKIINTLCLNEENLFWNWSKQELEENFDKLYKIDEYCKYITNRSKYE